MMNVTTQTRKAETMKTNETNLKRTHLGMVVSGTKFRLEVKHAEGYGPGETVWTKQDGEARWFAHQPIYVET